MHARTFSIVSVMVLALGGPTALAEPTFVRARLLDHSNPLRPIDRVNPIIAKVAYVGDGSDRNYLRDQQQLREEFDYSPSDGG